MVELSKDLFFLDSSKIVPSAPPPFTACDEYRTALETPPDQDGMSIVLLLIHSSRGHTLSGISAHSKVEVVVNSSRIYNRCIHSSGEGGSTGSKSKIARNGSSTLCLGFMAHARAPKRVSVTPVPIQLFCTLDVGYRNLCRATEFVLGFNLLARTQ